MGGLLSVELIVYPAYLEFRIRITNYKGVEVEEIHQFCMEVHLKVVSTLKAILGLHEHTRKMNFQLGFYCPGSLKDGEEPHFCGCLLSRTISTPNHLYAPSFHAVKMNAVFLMNVQSGLSTGRYVVDYIVWLIGFSVSFPACYIDTFYK